MRVLLCACACAISLFFCLYISVVCVVVYCICVYMRTLLSTLPMHLYPFQAYKCQHSKQCDRLSVHERVHVEVVLSDNFGANERSSSKRAPTRPHPAMAPILSMSE